MSDAPTVAEELERKVTETLTDALKELSLGRISPEEANASVGALWGAASGLVSRELMSLIADSRDAILARSACRRMRVFVKDQRVSVVMMPDTWHQFGALHRIVNGRGPKSTFTREADTLMEMTVKSNKVCDLMLREGFKEIV